MTSFSSKLPPSVRRLFRLPMSRSRLIREMDDELEAHLSMRVDELCALGMNERDARAEALRRFGDSNEFRDFAARRAGRRARRLGAAQWLEACAQDVRAAARQLRRTPVLSAVVVLTLAICIGATTAVYGVVRHLLLAPLPYQDGNRIASLEARSDGDGDARWNISTDLYRLWAARSRSLEEFAAYGGGRYPLGGIGDGPARDTARVALVTPSFLQMLRVRPTLGRTFTSDDARRGAPAVALLSDGVWRERFGADANVIGRSLTVNNTPRSIIGVVPAGVAAPIPENEREEVDVWLPLDMDSVTSVDGFARLRTGVTSAAASRELDALLHTFPDTGRLNGRRGEARTVPDRVEPWRRRSVELLFAAAAALLLIACADVAGLLLMRGWARRREFAIRQALGAGRGRLARMLLTESVLLGLPSGALGSLVAWLGMRRVALGYFAEARLDTAALIWTGAASITTVLLFGVGPAFLAWERSLDGAFRSGTGDGTSRVTGRAHVGLVVCQIALSLVFLAAAGVLARSFVTLVRTPVGYEPHGLFAISVRRMPAAGQRTAHRFTPTERAAAVRTLYETLAATPGVSEVAVGTLPMINVAPGPSAVEGPEGARPSGVPLMAMAYVSPEYFHVARIPLVRGRGFDASPVAANGEIIINQALARRLWPDRDPLGARLRLGNREDAVWLTVVGVAGDVQMPGGGTAAVFFNLQTYRPSTAAPMSAGSFVLRVRGESATLRPLLAQAVERARVGAALGDVVTAESTLEYAYRGPRFALSLFGAFALLAVALAAVGLFGIVAHAVARRTREIGIRVALGADPSALARTILGQSMKLVTVGCTIGLLGAYAAARGLSALVYQVSPTDPAALVGAIVLLIAVALAASAVPVRRALRVDPTDALRAE
jgi:putative ABC transport system permease protein